MSNLKSVAKATIEIVRGHTLEEGDFILVADRKCKVTSAPFGIGDMIEFESEDGCISSSDFDSRFMWYYRIVDCEEKDL